MTRLWDLPDILAHSREADFGQLQAFIDNSWDDHTLPALREYQFIRGESSIPLYASTKD